MNKKTQKIALTGVLIAVGTLLSVFVVFKMPYGGTITAFSMVPVMVLGYKYGMKWGLFSGLIFGILQMILGATTSGAFAGMSGFNLVLMALLDYIVAFVVLGSAGMFRNKIKNDIAAFALGGAVAGFLRFVCHFLSGLILWGSYAEWFFTDVFVNSFSAKIMETCTGTTLAAVYSFIYNALYMVPEIIITVIGIVVIMAVVPLKKLIVSKD